MKYLRRPSPSLIVATTAVVLASTGSAIAAKAITSKDIKNGTIQLADLSNAARGALSGGRGPQGPVGPAGGNGAAGANGAAGKDGAPGAPGVTDVISSSTGPAHLNASGDVASLSLPAGVWAVFAHVGAAHSDPVVSQRLECAISGPGASGSDFSKLRLPPNTDGANSLVFSDMSLHAVVTLTAPTVVKTTCAIVGAAGGSPTGFDFTTHKMTAMRVSNVTAQ